MAKVIKVHHITHQPSHLHVNSMYSQESIYATRSVTCFLLDKVQQNQAQILCARTVVNTKTKQKSGQKTATDLADICSGLVQINVEGVFRGIVRRLVNRVLRDHIIGGHLR